MRSVELIELLAHRKVDTRPLYISLSW